MAHLYQFLTTTGDLDAAGLGQIADNILTLQVFPELNVSGFGTGSPVAGGSQGVSRTRGMHWGCCDMETFASLSGREVGPFREALLVQGLWELGQARGAGWSNYTLASDLAYGIAEWGMERSLWSAPWTNP